MQPLCLIIRTAGTNCEAELAGTLLDYFKDRNRNYLLVHTYQNVKFPDLDDINAIITLGCPESILNYYQFDYLKKLYHRPVIY